MIQNSFICKLINVQASMKEKLIIVPLSSHEVDGVRKEKERLTAAGADH